MAGDELLSAFKVASFAFDEEKAVMEVKKESVEEETKDWVSNNNKLFIVIITEYYWQFNKYISVMVYYLYVILKQDSYFIILFIFNLQDDIIPENVRNTIAEQEKNKEMEDLYLPPRRKNLQQNNADESEFLI